MKIPLQFDSHILYILNYLLTITVTEHCIQLLSATPGTTQIRLALPFGIIQSTPERTDLYSAKARQEFVVSWRFREPKRVTAAGNPQSWSSSVDCQGEL
jgi:hypothetical protein